MRKCLLGLAIVLALGVIACTRLGTTSDAVLSPTPSDSMASNETSSPLPSDAADSGQYPSRAPVDADSISPVRVASAPSTPPQTATQQSGLQPGKPIPESEQATAEPYLQTESAALLARVSIDPINITVSLGESVQLELSAFDQFDNPIPQVNATWNATAGGSITSAALLRLQQRPEITQIR